MPPPGQPKEIRSLTGLRGVAALYIVAYHYYGEGLAFTSPLKTLLGHGYLAVDLFFVLSGFVMAMNYRTMFAARFSVAAWKRFLGRRIARVYPLYLVCTVASFLIAVRTHEPAARGPGMYKALALNVAMVQLWGFPKGHSFDLAAWSISAEWAAYLLFPLLLTPALSCRRWVGWMTGMICVGALVGLCLLPATMRHDLNPLQLLDYAAPFYGLAVARCLAEFVLGLLAFRVAGSAFGEAMSANRWGAPVVCLATLAGLCVARTDVLTVLLFFLLIVCLAAGGHLPNRLLASRVAEFFGLLSYAIYLAHMMLSHAIYSVAHRAAAHGVRFALGLSLLMILPVAMLLNRFVEAPGRVWLRRLFERNPPLTPLERPASLS